MLGTILSTTFTSIGIALSRRHGVVHIDTAKIQTPLLRQGTNFFLAIGDKTLEFAERQGVDVNGMVGSANSKDTEPRTRK